MPKAYPSAHILEALQSQTLEWWKRLAELIDNSLDADANRIAISFRAKHLTVIDDGFGVKDPQVIVTLGHHEKHSRKGLGCYGIGAKDAWLCTGPVIQIDSIHKGVRRRLSVDVRQMARNDWDIPETSCQETTEPSRTVIRIEMRQPAPQWKGIADRLGWAFAPALNAGKQIIHTDTNTPIMACKLPHLRNVVRDEFQVEGKPVSIEIGLIEDGELVLFGPFWIQYRHRSISSSGIGTKGRCLGKLAGRIVLGDGWQLSKNKDEFFCNRDLLEDEIFRRIEPLLTECESTAEQIQTDALRLTLDQRINAAMKGQFREKRDQTRETTGSKFPRFSGKKRRNATKTSDKPGSVEVEKQQLRRGFSIGFVSEDTEFFGRFDAMGKIVILNLNHPVIGVWKQDNNCDALLSAAGVILSHHDANTDGDQKIFGCAVGDFLEPYIKLVTSLVKTREVASDEQY